MTKAQAKKKLIEISNMGKMELSRFVQDLFLAKEDMSPKVFKVLDKASQLQYAYLSDSISTGTFVELSDDISFD